MQLSNEEFAVSFFPLQNTTAKISWLPDNSPVHPPFRDQSIEKKLMGGGEKRVPVSLVQLIRHPPWCRNGTFLPKQNCLSHEEQKKGTQTEAEKKGEGGSVVSVGRLWNAGLSSSSVFFSINHL